MTDYIIAIGNSCSDGIDLCRFRGELEDVKKKLIELVLKDKANDEDNWDYGTEDIDEIEIIGNDINAYATYHDYHIDYTARALSDFNFI